MTLASWYGPGFNGQRTASGEVYHQGDLTAASRTLPLGSRVRVTDLRSGRSVVVRINDRGPYVHGRGIDLSQRAAQRIGLNHCGVARVSVSPLGTTRAAAPDTGSEADLTDARPRHHQGTGYARRRYSEYSAGRARHRSRRIVTNPVGHWLMAVMR